MEFNQKVELPQREGWVAFFTVSTCSPATEPHLTRLGGRLSLVTSRSWHVSRIRFNAAAWGSHVPSLATSIVPSCSWQNNLAWAVDVAVDVSDVVKVVVTDVVPVDVADDVPVVVCVVWRPPPPHAQQANPACTPPGPNSDTCERFVFTPAATP